MGDLSRRRPNSSGKGKRAEKVITPTARLGGWAASARALIVLVRAARIAGRTVAAAATAAAAAITITADADVQLRGSRATEQAIARVGEQR